MSMTGPVTMKTANTLNVQFWRLECLRHSLLRFIKSTGLFLKKKRNGNLYEWEGLFKLGFIKQSNGP